MKAKFFRQNIKQIASGSLIIWLSGVVFLFCCGMPKALASNDESCPLAKTRHCSKQLNSGAVSESASLESLQTLECCKILPLVFDKARKIEKIQKAETAQTFVKVFQPLFSVSNCQSLAPMYFHSFVINRENTHLRNCVFRI